MPTKWFEGTVIEIDQISEKVRKYFVKLSEPESFQYEAGQFVTFDLPVSEKRLQRWRSYSIANRPDNSNILEFCIVYLDGGIGSGFFFNEVKIGSVLKFKGPDGAFVLKIPIEYDLVLLCTGTGVAPFKSMLDHIFFHNIPHRNIHLIFGTRKEEDIIYRNEFEAYASSKKDFIYDVVLSQEPNWHGIKGHIHQVYLQKYDVPRSDIKFMICGWSKMIDEAVANLLITSKYDRTQIHYELYG
jgi:CDP-4-dehydro-6-deoxyglucose reductase